VVHKEFLTHYSEYFRGALENNFAEATTRQFELDHMIPKTFKHFVDWVYTQKVHDIPVQGSNRPVRNGIEVVYADSVQEGVYVEEWIDLWILADYLQVRSLQNAIMVKLATTVENSQCLMGTVSHKKLYENTCKGSKLRK